MVRQVYNCKKGGSRFVINAKKGTQLVNKQVVTLVHRFQKGITAGTLFAFAERGVHVVFSCKKGIMTTQKFRTGGSCDNHPFCYIVLVRNTLCNLYAHFTPLSATNVPLFLDFTPLFATNVPPFYTLI